MIFFESKLTLYYINVFLDSVVSYGLGRRRRSAGESLDVRFEKVLGLGRLSRSSNF